MRVLKSPQGLALLAVLAFAVYYWRFTHVSLYTGFSQDDLMNLYFAWREPWGDILKSNLFWPTGTFRPFGTLFYRSVLEQFGYQAVPFRIICYVLLWVNVPVAYWFVKRVTGSREVGLLAALLHCVHATTSPSTTVPAIATTCLRSCFSTSLSGSRSAQGRPLGSGLSP
jgi:hypothetical protein